MRRALLVVAAAIGAAGVIWMAAQIASSPPAPPAPMAAMLPQGALLEIESPDLATLLQDWQQSPEQASWLKSDNYGEFSRSRLFARLGEAQAQFAGAAGLAPDGAFLNEIAGTQSAFAWYDIGRLEFLYISRLPAGKAEQTRLMQSKSSFSARQVGSATFYVRTRADDQGGDARTVAFAVSGDYLLLATREDLLANALTLMAHSSSDSLATQPWYLDAGNAAAASAQTPVLRMALDLDRLVRTPYFRSYWVQQNVTEMKQYRAAMVDLYREPTQMREERVLLPRTVEAPDASQAELGSLLALVPPQAAVYRALATGDASVAVAALDQKLLGRPTSPYVDPRVAPEADLSEQTTGEASDLETRIDAAPLPPTNPEEQMKLLRAQIADAGVVGVLTVDSNQPGAAGAPPGAAAMWVPIHSGVVIRATRAWDQTAMESALTDALGPQLSAGNLGLAWTAQSAGYASLGQARPLQIAVRGNLLLVTGDAQMMEQMLARVSQPTAAPIAATFVGGFDHQAAAAPFARLSSLIDRVDASEATGAPGPPPNGNAPADGNAPPFFSGDLAGLSRTLAAMRSERVVERRDGPVVRQTVTYVWQH
jgi:hypothetical protein